jgi:hypothetical protein
MAYDDGAASGWTEAAERAAGGADGAAARASETAAEIIGIGNPL